MGQTDHGGPGGQRDTRILLLVANQQEREHGELRLAPVGLPQVTAQQHDEQGGPKAVERQEAEAPVDHALVLRVGAVHRHIRGQVRHLFLHSVREPVTAGLTPLYPLLNLWRNRDYNSDEHASPKAGQGQSRGLGWGTGRGRGKGSAQAGVSRGKRQAELELAVERQLELHRVVDPGLLSVVL